MERFTSRKFILAVVAGLVVILNKAFDFNFSETEILLIVGSLLTFVGVEGGIDAVREAKK